MAKTLEEILGFEAMLGIVEAIKTGVPDVIPPAFLAPRTSVEGNRGQYTRVEGTRKTARQVHYGAPSTRREQKGISVQPVTLIHLFEHILHTPNALSQLMSFDNPARQRRGQQEIDRQTGLFFDLFRNTRLSAFYSMLTLGAIYFDKDGNLLPSSSNALVTVDFGVPAGNKDQLDWDGTGAIIGASWGTAGTDIVGDVEELRRASVQLTGYPLAHAFYGPNILNYFLGNTVLKELINRSDARRDSAAAGMIPSPFLGFQWHEAQTALYQDSGDTYRYWFGDDTIVFTPEPSADWVEWIDGSYLAPSTIDVTSNVSGAISSLEEVQGFGSWCTLNDDPVTVKQLAVDTFLPVLKVPKAIFIADVTP